MEDLARKYKYENALRINARAKAFPKYEKEVHIGSDGNFTMEFNDINKMALWFATAKSSACNQKYLHRGISFNWKKMQAEYGKSFVYRLAEKIDIIRKLEAKTNES